MSKNHNVTYLPPVRLVSFDEKIDYIASELLNLATESQINIKETIRLYHHTEEGIDKRRLLSDPVTGGDPRAPGDEVLAGMLLDMQRDHERVNARIKKRLQRNRVREIDMVNQEMRRFVEKWTAKMDKIEGWNDPERVHERRIEQAASHPTAEIVH